MSKISSLIRPNIANLAPYSSARHEFQGIAKVSLDANENPYESGLNRYPDPLQLELKRILAQIKNVEVEKMFLGNGSDEAIDLLYRIFCRPGVDNVIITPPTYGMYKVSADINDVEIREVVLSDTYQLRTSEILEATDKNSKLIWVCSPNNPTGNLLKKRDVRELLDNFDGIVVVDEAYIDFANEVSWSQAIDHYENLVVLQTLSKAWGMAGIRLGMAFAQETIINLLNKVKPPYNINTLTQNTAKESLIEQKFNQQLNEILEQRSFLESELRNLPMVEKIFPSDSNFILTRLKDAQGVFQYLRDEGIVVRNRSRVILCDDCLRITVGTPDENLILLEALKNI